ncbi:Sel1 repeat-containing protein [Besnoitia besnoiti]|uniref:Sel1 repeat-containing protein n=1 Tax=Besnoitia besnoiti TaxID=94643 RepID=A0A2A9MB70_BESBE|nr:Sel1 repeat-containing protein [Besnoitia besnoiti]PFH32630.1 Sel1 repeat-containing protein [Besnoitia besnoiti]
MLLMEAEGRSFHVYDLLANCSERDVRCQYELGVFYFLGVPPLPARNLTASLVLWHGAALGGSADAQYALALLHSNLRDLPPLPAFASSPGASAAAARRPAAPPPRVVVDDDLSVTLQDDGGAAAALDFSAVARYSEALMRRQEEIEAQQRNLWWLPLRVLERGWALVTAARDSLLGNAPRARTDAELRALFGAAEDAARSMPNFAANPGGAALAELYAAAASGHPGASMALAARTQLATADVSMRQGQACSAAVNFYLPYAKRVAVSYGGGIPQAPELLRFHSPAASVSGVPAAGGGLLRFAPASLSPGESAAAAPRGTGRRDEREGSAALHRLHPDSPDLDVLSELAHRGNADMQLALGKRYLFGVDGIQQNPQRARELLSGAADAGRTEARALLGYMDALGVGGEPDLFSATMHFLAAAARDDQPMALNGLGYLHFFGTEFIHKNELAAFHLFNISAAHAFPDAEANLAAMFVTGHGHAQSFVKAMHAYTKALRSGSTGAAYALGLMHLNGLGAVRDCAVASSLLKRVCEKGGYVTKNLQKAYMLYERGLFEEAAFHLLLLAEAGHEVSQTNLAFMFDSGLTDLFFDGTVERQRLHAQRFYQMAAANGSPLAELRLGDFAYYGYGVEKQIRARRPTEPLLDDDGNDMSDWISEAYEVYTPRRPSLRVAVGHYHRVADMTPDAKWLAGYVAKASFNLGFMRMQGLGLTQDFGLARQHFERCLYVDPAAPRAPVYLALGLLKFLKWRQEVDLRQILRELLEDPRIVLLLLMFVLMTALALLRVLTRRLQPPPHDVFFASHAHPVAPPSAPAPSAASSGSLGSSASPASSPASSGPASAASTSAAAAAPSAEPDSKSPTEARAPSLFESPVRRSSYPHFRGVCRGSSLPSSFLPTAGVSSGVSLEPEAPAPPAVGGPTEPAEDEGGLQANSGSSGAAHSDRMRRAQLFEAAAAKREKEAAALQLGESRENAFSSETDHEAQGGDSQGSEQVEGGQALPATSHANGLGAENAGGYAGFEHESDAVPHLQAEPSQSVDTAEGGMLQATGKDIWMRSEDGNRASVSMQSEMPGVSREQAENGNGESARSKDFDADVRTS